MKTTEAQALEQASVKQYCKAMRAPVIGANFVSLAEQAVKESHSHVQYLEALLAMECEERDRHAIENRIREARLPRMKTLEEFDFSQAPQIPAARVRDLAEEARVSVRNIRRDANDELKKKQKSGDITEDDEKRGHEDIQKMTDDFINDINAVLEEKEKEIMEI